VFIAKGDLLDLYFHCPGWSPCFEADHQERQQWSISVGGPSERTLMHCPAVWLLNSFGLAIRTAQAQDA
jgi:hypothetical protein